MEILESFLKKYQNLDFVDIYDIAKKYGLKVIEYDLGKVDGILFKNYIGVNIKNSLKEKRFIIAHEFCHFLLNEKSFSVGIYHSKNYKEKRADNFATNLLLPTKIFLEKYKEFENIPTLSDIFGVPEKVIEMKIKLLKNFNT